MLYIRYTTGITGAPLLVALDTDAEDHTGARVGSVLWFDLRYPDHRGGRPETPTPFNVAGQFITDHHASSLAAGGDPTGSFVLWGEENAAWHVAPERLREIRDWIAGCYRREGREVPADTWPTLSV